MTGSKDKPYRNLRNEMFNLGLTQNYIGNKLLNYKSSKSICDRFNKKQDFNVQEAYIILKKIGKSAKDIVDIFPPDIEFN